ncbi:putative oxidoreductase YrbE [Crassostrea virginica]
MLIRRLAKFSRETTSSSLLRRTSRAPCKNVQKSQSLWLSTVQEKPAQKRRLNVGVFGAGRIASSVHIPNILSDRRYNINWVIEEDEERAHKVKDQLYLQNTPFLKFKDRQSLLADKGLDAVFVFTPTATHAEIICDSLKQGKSVMVEKPTAETFSDIKTCYDTAENHGAVLLTSFQRRFDPAFASLKETTQSGSLGDLQLLRLTSRDNPKPSYEFLSTTDQEGCNLISDMAIHDIDMLVWLTSCATPKSVFVMTHIRDETLQKIGEPDAGVIAINFNDGMMATVDVFRECVYGYDIRTEVFGTKGMAMADNPRRSSFTVDFMQGSTSPPLHYSFPQRFEKAFEMSVAHFYSCLSGEAKPLVTKDECLLTAKIIEKAVESYKTGQVVNF